MRYSLRIASVLAIAGAGALFALDSDQAVLPAGDIESARAGAVEVALPAAVSDSAADARQLTRAYEDVLTVGKGDTLMALMVDAGVPASTADRAIRAMAKIYKPRRIKPGHRFVLTLEPQLASNAPPRLLSLTFAESVERDITVARTEGDRFTAKVIARPLTRVPVHADGRIETSLYVAGVESGLQQSTLADLIQIFSFDVDFQRDIRRGDGFALMYDEYRDEAGRRVKSGSIQIAEMTLSGRKIRLYRYKTKDGFFDFYNAKGQSVRKALLRTPIDGARISSNFGMRRHPILGYNKMHRGLDFAARRGTPIYAAGNGFVEYAGRNGGYGKYVRIRHNSTFKTAYAHMHRYGKGIRKGRRVKQGQIIGYVGSTGRSTGPHLHYEVHKNGRKVNPRSIKLPSGRKLKGQELRAFQSRVATLEAQYTDLVRPQQLAERPTN